MTRKLSSKICRRCYKAIMVAEESSHPLEKDATGSALLIWDADDQQWHFCGWYCESCGKILIESGDEYDWS